MWSVSLPVEKHGVAIQRKVISTGLPTAVGNSDVVYTLVNMLYEVTHGSYYAGKGKGHPAQAEVAQGVPGRLRPRIFLTFGTTRVVGRRP